MSRALTIIAVCAMFVPGVAKADQSCLNALEENSNIIEVDELISKLSRVNFNKDEFETSKAYNDRVVSELTLAKIPLGKLIVVKKLFDSKYIKYDADRQLLNYIQWGASNRSLGCSSITGYGTPFHDMRDQICSRIYGEKHLNLKFVEKVTGSYEATSAAGATVSVTVVEYDQFGLLEGPLENLDSELWTKIDDDNVIFSIPSLPEVARALKQHTILIVGFRMKPPFLVYGTSKMSATFSNPIDHTWHHRLAFVDMQCAGIRGASGKIIAKQALR